MALLELGTTDEYFEAPYEEYPCFIKTDDKFRILHKIAFIEIA